jgi:hypothetical protein
LLKAHLASSSETHSSSNKTTHLLTTATYQSIDHFQDHIAAASHFLVNGLCGKILIHNFHFLDKWLLIAFLAASICLDVISAGVMAFTQNDQKLKVVHHFAAQCNAVLHLLCFLYFVFFGCNIVKN